MKVPPKRKGNGSTFKFKAKSTTGLNESPSEKEGKSVKLSQKAADIARPQ